MPALIFCITIAIIIGYSWQDVIPQFPYLMVESLYVCCSVNARCWLGGCLASFHCCYYRDNMWPHWVTRAETDFGPDHDPCNLLENHHRDRTTAQRITGVCCTSVGSRPWNSRQ